MDLTELLEIYTLDQRYHVVYPGMERQVLARVVRHVPSRVDQPACVVYSKLTTESADEEIAAQIAYFTSRQQSFEWKVYHYDQPDNLIDRLIAAGFEAQPTETVLVLDLAEAPGELFSAPSAGIRRLTQADELHDVRIIKREVWGDEGPDFEDYLKDVLTCFGDRASIYVIDVDGEPAAVGWVFFPEGSLFGSLWGGSTRPHYRKRGLYTALLSHRAREARDRGVRYLTVDAGPMSRPILEKFGFIALTPVTGCEWQPK